MKKNIKLFASFLILLIFQAAAPAQVTHPEWSYDKVIYEVNIRQFIPEGTFNAFSEHLEEIKELGVGIIWLMPIHPIGEKNRKGSLGSYYSVKDYFAINPEFGSLSDFKSLVKKIHELDMYVIIDWVANHTAWDNKMTEEHPEWFMKDLSGNFIPPVPDWQDVVDLNYDNKELWQYMKGAMKYWVEDCDIDGYRCDVAGMVPIEFWSMIRKELDNIKPVFLLAEDESPLMHQAFDMTYSWQMLNFINAVPKKEKNAEDFSKYFDEEKKNYTENSFRMRFTSNHDENTWQGTVFERLGEAAEIMAVFTNIIPGMPLIYNGQEAGLDKRLEFFEKDTIQWKSHKFRDIYRKLFHLKRENKTLLNGSKGGELINIFSSKNVFAFMREKEEDKIIGIFNFSSEKTSFEINNELLKGNYKDIFSDEKLGFNSKENFDFEPWEYKILVKE